MIETRNLTKMRRSGRVVDDLTFTAPDGCVTGLVGPNGSGKTSTMRMIAGLDRPTRGSATVDGRPTPEHPVPQHAVGVVLDGRSVPGGMTVRGHLRWLAAAGRIPARRREEVLEEVGLAPAASRRVETLSLGMRQRLGIAAALLGDPGTLVLDEPMNGLDPDGIRWIRSLVRQLAARGRCVLVSSHLMAEMQRCADHVVVLGAGRLLGHLDLADLPPGTSLEDAYLGLASRAARFAAGTQSGGGG